MKKVILIALVAFMGTLASCNSGSVNSNPTISTEKDSLSYAIGSYMSEQLKSWGMTNADIDLNIVAGAIAASLDTTAAKPKITAEQANEILRHYVMEVVPLRNKEKSEAFLKEVKEKNPNVKETASGLLYEIIKPGSADMMPSATDTVQVQYTGKLPDGTVFDSTVERGEPANFPVNRVIPGWSEGIQLIGEGGEIKLWIPSALAYGEQGAGGRIGQNQAITFEVTLEKVMKDTATTATEVK